MNSIDAAIPAALADVALIDVKVCAAAAGRATSSWLQLVHEGKAPQPVTRGPRCTRWRLADVRAWLIEQAETGADTEESVALQQRNAEKLVRARARRAEMLQAKRSAATHEPAAAEA